MVAVAVTVAFRDVSTSALVNLTWTIANAARVERTHAVIHVVADAIRIGVFSAIATAKAQSVFLVAVTVAVACGDVSTPALVNVPCAIAHAARVERTHAVIHVVADAIGIGVSRAIATANAEGVELVAVAVAVAFWDVSTTALVNGSLAAAYAAGVELTYARIFVVADAIEINVCRTIPTTLKQGVKLGAVAVTIPCGNGVTTALVDGSRAVANPTGVKLAHAVVYIVTDAIGIVVRGAASTTFSDSISVVDA